MNSFLYLYINRKEREFMLYLGKIKIESYFIYIYDSF